MASDDLEYKEIITLVLCTIFGAFLFKILGGEQLTYAQLLYWKNFMKILQSSTVKKKKKKIAASEFGTMGGWVNDFFCF